MRYAYPVEVKRAADGVTVTCLDVPELVATGSSRAEALLRAADALVTAIDGSPAGSLSVSVPSFRYRTVRTVLRDAVLDAARAATAALDVANRRVSFG